MQVALGLGLPEDPPPVIRMLIRGWIAFIEELTVSWIDEVPTDGSRPSGTLDRADVRVVARAEPDPAARAREGRTGHSGSAALTDTRTVRGSPALDDLDRDREAVPGHLAARRTRRSG